MKAKAKAGALGALALAMLMLAGCGAAPVEATSGNPLQVTDMLGRQIALDAPAERVVALAPSDCEILYALGAGDTLVPSILNLVSMWGVRITAAALLAPRIGLAGVWLAMCGELCFRGVLFLIRLLRERWLDRKVFG